MVGYVGPNTEEKLAFGRGITMGKKKKNNGNNLLKFGSKRNPEWAEMEGVKKWLTDLSHRLTIRKVELKLNDPAMAREFREFLIDLPDWIDVGDVEVEPRNDEELYLAHRDWFESLPASGAFRVSWLEKRSIKDQ
jgi:hypothetical protein